MGGVEINEIWAIVGTFEERLSSACHTVNSISENVADKWGHSIPPLSNAEILSRTVPQAERRVTDEGGRVAVGGQNGWAYFDYHLAMFGPEEFVGGPVELIIADPVYGCDPKEYKRPVK